MLPAVPRMAVVMMLSAPSRAPRFGSSLSRLAARRMMCNAANAEKDILRGVFQDHKDTIARIADMAEAASERWSVNVSPFLEPPALADALMVIGRMTDVEARPMGGYASAERCRLLLGRTEVLDGEDASTHIGVIEVAGNFLFDAATHRDFLGAVLASGIEKNRIGDIILQGERGAQVIAVPEIADYLCGALTRVRSVTVTARRVSLTDLKVQPPKMTAIKTVEASMRLDAVASAAFRLSRSKMQDFIDGGDVRVNWRSVTKGSVAVKQGDVITVRGKGRAVIGTVNETAKERFAIEIQRYV